MGSIFTRPIDEIDNYSGNRAYLFRRNSDGLETVFRVINRTTNIVSSTCTIYTDVTLPIGQSAVYTYSEGYYRSTKRVNQLDINFTANVWARSKDNDLLDFSQFYHVMIKTHRQTSYTQICTIIIQSKRPDRLLRGLTIGGLPLDTYDIHIRPAVLVLDGVSGSSPCLVLRDWGSFAQVGVTAFSGGAPYVRSQGYTETNPTAYNPNSDQSKDLRPSNSAQSGSTLQMINCNEIEYPNSTVRTRNLALTGYATVESVVHFDAQLNGNLNMQFFVTEGIACFKPIATGTADAGSGGTSLSAFGINPPSLTNLVVHNLDKRVTAIVTGITSGPAYQITTAVSLLWEEGDRWLLRSWGSSCWWPEIYGHLSHDPRFGLSEQFIADYDIDWQSIIDETKWVAGINEHNQSFAWHGILRESKEIAAINAEMCKQVMLFPCKRSGRSGFFAQKTPITSNGAIYNSSNASKFRIEYSAVDRSRINQITIVYRELEQSWMSEPELQFTQQSVTARTWGVSKVLEAIFSRTIQMPNCTSRNQAIKSAQILLNLARFGGQISISLSADTIESLSLPVGELFRVQTATTAYDGQLSGMVVEVNGNSARLDRDPVLAEGLTTNIGSGLSDSNIDFIRAGVEIGDIIINLETGTTSTINSISTHNLNCTPSIAIDTYYRIIDLTTSGYVAIIGGSGTSTPSPFTNTYISGHVWHTFATTPEVTDVVLIGRINTNDRLFQCLSCNPTIGAINQNGTAQVESPIIGANWTSKFYDYSDVEVITRDVVINPAI